MAEEQWVATDDAAVELGLTTRQVYSLIDQGYLAAPKAGKRVLVSAEDVCRRRDKGGEGTARVREPRTPPPSPGSAHGQRDV
jgi:excisionase family DNA binding protein